MKLKLRDEKPVSLRIISTYLFLSLRFNRRFWKALCWTKRRTVICGTKLMPYQQILMEAPGGNLKVFFKNFFFNSLMVLQMGQERPMVQTILYSNIHNPHPDLPCSSAAFAGPCHRKGFADPECSPKESLQ